MFGAAFTLKEREDSITSFLNHCSQKIYVNWARQLRMMNRLLDYLGANRVSFRKTWDAAGSCNETVDIINWRNNGQRALLRNDIRVNPAECSRYSCRPYIVVCISHPVRPPPHTHRVLFTVTISLQDTILSCSATLSASYASLLRIVAGTMTRLHPSRRNQLLGGSRAARIYRNKLPRSCAARQSGVYLSELIHGINFERESEISRRYQAERNSDKFRKKAKRDIFEKSRTIERLMPRVFTLKMQRRVRRTPQHFVIPATTIGASELLINCNPGLFPSGTSGATGLIATTEMEFKLAGITRREGSSSFFLFVLSSRTGSAPFFFFSPSRPNYFASKIFRSRRAVSLAVYSAR